MKLDGIFLCVRCHGTKTDLKIVKGEGTVCIDEEACEIVREVNPGG